MLFAVLVGTLSATTYLIREDDKIGVFYVDHRAVAKEAYDVSGTISKAKGKKINGTVHELLPSNHGLTIAKYKYENSVRNGEGKKYSEDGKKVLETVNYKEGKLDGKRSVWNYEKVLLFEEEYKEGMLLSKIEYDAKGKVKKETKFDSSEKKEPVKEKKEVQEK